MFSYAFEIKSLSFRPGSAQDAVDLSTQDSRGQPLAVGVDSGSLGFYPVRGTRRDFVAKTGAVVEDDAYNFPCDEVDKGAAFDFQITDNTVVSVPLSDFVRERAPDGKTCKTFIGATNHQPTSEGPIWSESIIVATANFVLLRCLGRPTISAQVIRRP